MYEYKVVETDSMDPPLLEAKLAELGDEGWRVRVACPIRWNIKSDGGHLSANILILERTKERSR